LAVFCISDERFEIGNFATKHQSV
jgi:hypothetical protein